MALLSLTCPHCSRERVQFYSVAAVQRPGEHVWTTFFACNACARGVAAEIAMSGDPHSIKGDLAVAGLSSEIRRVYPAAPKLAAPQHTPERASRYFLQALDGAQRKSFDAAGAMCRKAIEAAIYGIDASLKGPLVTRIDALSAAHKLTPDLKEWAHAIRLDGNYAVHGDDFTEEEAAQIISFTELFLMYVFTLPGMLAERKAKREPQA